MNDTMGEPREETEFPGDERTPEWGINAAIRITDLEEAVRVLAEQNEQLKRAFREFVSYPGSPYMARARAREFLDGKG